MSLTNRIPSSHGTPFPTRGASQGEQDSEADPGGSLVVMLLVLMCCSNLHVHAHVPWLGNELTSLPEIGEEDEQDAQVKAHQ
jgi:hypothetical protein